MFYFSHMYFFLHKPIPKKFRRCITKYIIDSHSLAVEFGRYKTLPKIKVDVIIYNSCMLFTIARLHALQRLSEAYWLRIFECITYVYTSKLCTILTSLWRKVEINNNNNK